MLFSICSSTNCPGQHYTYLLFLHSGFTCIPYLHSGLHALIINVTLCTWVRDIQLSNMWSTMKLNISVWECHCLNNTCINSQMCVCVPVPVLMNLYYCVKQDFIANAKQYYIRALNKNVLLPFLFCLFSFCVCMCVCVGVFSATTNSWTPQTAAKKVLRNCTLQCIQMITNSTGKTLCWKFVE